MDAPARAANDEAHALPPRPGVWLALAVALGASALVYAPITRIYFHEDDFFLLYELTNDSFLTAILRPYLGHANLVRNLVAGATLGIFGPRPEAFQATVLVGHLVAVGVLFRVILQVGHSALVACLGALLWGTCPTHIGTLGWYAAFGHTLCTIFTLLAFGIVVAARDDPRGLTPRRILACALLLAASATSFGAGLGLALAFPAVVWLLAPPRRSLRPAAIATVAIPALALAVFVGQRLAFAALGAPVEDEQSIMLNLELLDPAYAANLLAQFVGFGIASLVAAPFVVEVSWPSPGPVAAVALVALGVLRGAWRGTARERRVLLACVVLVGAAYGSVVAGRSGLMAAFGMVPERIGTVARYHYAAQAWLTLAIATATAILLRGLRPAAARALACVAIGAVVVGHLVRPHTYEESPRVRAGVAYTLARIRTAAAAVPPGDVVRIRNEPFRAAPILAKQPLVFPGIAGVFLVFHPGDEVDGRRVVFEAPRAQVDDARRRGGPIAALLVPPPDGQPDPPY